MKYSPIKTILIFAIALLPLLQAFAQKPLKVIILRHAEKPENGDNLSCQGFNRAMKLPAVITAKFGVPDYAYVPAPSVGKTTKSGRMMQTILPLAIKYNLSVNTRYEVEQTQQLAANILKKQGTVIVVWEHDNIPAIIAALGVKFQKLKWKGQDFDSIWIVTGSGKKRVLTTDSQGITPSGSCAF